MFCFSQRTRTYLMKRSTSLQMNLYCLWKHFGVGTQFHSEVMRHWTSAVSEQEGWFWSLSRQILPGRTGFPIFDTQRLLDAGPVALTEIPRAAILFVSLFWVLDLLAIDSKWQNRAETVDHMSWFNPSQQPSTMQPLPPSPSQWGEEEERKKSKTHGLR